MQYQLVGKTGLRVSRICLGTMTFGKTTPDGSNQADSAAVFDAFAEAGGTFIDTADMYAGGESERILADLIAADRDHFVLATKYSQIVDPAHKSITATGNSRKAMVRAVEASLKRMKTDYIDLFYLHVWDGTTPTEEVMRAMDDLVRSGKILYVGLSNIPAWIVARAQTLAELRAFAPVAALQIQYSLAARTPERDLIPMCDSLGIAVTAWGPLASGVLSGKYKAGDERTSRNHPIRPEVMKIAEAVGAVGSRLGATPAQVALAWVLQSGAIPVIGARTLAQLNDNLGALDVALDAQAMADLDEATAIAGGYPHELLASPFMQQLFAGQRDQLIPPGRIVS